jgi:hypothetical protein
MAHGSRHQGGAGNGAPKRELRDLSIKGALLFGAVLIAGIVISMVFMMWTFDLLAKREDRSQVPPPSLVRGDSPMLPPKPRLQMNPIRELAAVREAERERLESYGWVDREKGIAHIPIERAMEITLERGLPARAPGAGAAPAEETAP